MSPVTHCPFCGEPQRQSAPVVSVIVWTASQLRGRPLVPEGDQSVCLNPECQSIAQLVSRVADSDPHTRDAGPWNAAVVTFADKRTVKLEVLAPSLSLA
jgi:hypothetical protein